VVDPEGVAVRRGVYYFDGTNWRASSVELRLYGEIWITTEQFPYKGRHPVDRSVVDADTALAHEYNFHINPAIASVRSIINAFARRAFRSEQEIKDAYILLVTQVSTRFRHSMRNTQIRENNMR